MNRTHYIISQFFISFEDDLLRLFGSDRFRPMLEKLSGGEGEDSEQAVALILAFGMTMNFTFNEDGTGSTDSTYQDETQRAAFTYTVEDGKLTMTPEAEEGEAAAEPEEIDFRIEDGKLYMTMDDQTLIFSKK